MAYVTDSDHQYASGGILVDISFTLNVLAFSNFVFLLDRLSTNDETAFVFMFIVSVCFALRTLILVSNRLFLLLKQQTVEWLFEAGVVLFIAGIQTPIHVSPLIKVSYLIAGVLLTIAVVCIAATKHLSYICTRN